MYPMGACLRCRLGCANLHSYPENQSHISFIVSAYDMHRDKEPKCGPGCSEPAWDLGKSFPCAQNRRPMQ